MTGHELLLALAGRLPDEALARARRLVFDGAVAAAAGLVAGLLAADPVLLTEAELAAIRELSGDLSALPEAMPVAGPVPVEFGFSFLDPDGGVGRDEVDEALAAASEAAGQGVVAVWRTWRYFAEGTSRGQDRGPVPATLAGSAAEPDHPHRVYLVQVTDQALAQGVGSSLVRAASELAGGWEGVGLEVIALGAELAGYQRAALAQSLLLWAATAGPEFTLATVPAGFAAGHPVIGELSRREALAGYLRSGFPVLMTTAADGDVADPGAGLVVPGGYRTDGEWIWAEAIEYYLSRYRLAPEPDLVAHIEARLRRGELVPALDPETVTRAGDFLAAG